MLNPKFERRTPDNFTYVEAVRQWRAEAVDENLEVFRGPVNLLPLVDAYADLKLETIFSNFRINEYLLRKEVLKHTTDFDLFYTQVNAESKQAINSMRQLLGTEGGSVETDTDNFFDLRQPAQPKATFLLEALGLENEESLNQLLLAKSAAQPTKLQELTQLIDNHLDQLLLIEKETGMRNYQYSLSSMHEDEYSIITFYFNCELAVREVAEVLAESTEIDISTWNKSCRQRYLTPLRRLLNFDDSGQPAVNFLEGRLNSYRLSLSGVLHYLQGVTKS